jgi:hypothetical protein
MEFNHSIIDAARKTVEEQGIPAEPLGISNYPGMFVAKSDCAKIQAMSFFTSAGERFVVGPLLKG